MTSHASINKMEMFTVQEAIERRVHKALDMHLITIIYFLETFLSRATNILQNNSTFVIQTRIYKTSIVYSNVILNMHLYLIK